jgi:hypothetical protein
MTLLVLLVVLVVPADSQVLQLISELLEERHDEAAWVRSFV